MQYDAGQERLSAEAVCVTLLRDAGRPALVYCASGNRVGATAALRAVWVEGLPAEEAIAIGRDWGLKGLEDEVRRRISEAR